MREGEYKVAVPMFNLAHELFASASKLLSESTSAVDEAVRVVQVALLVSSACARHSQPLQHLLFGEKRPSKRFARANKIFVIARTMLQRGLLLKHTRNGRNFLRHFGTGETLKQYGD